MCYHWLFISGQVVAVVTWTVTLMCYLWLLFSGLVVVTLSVALIYWSYHYQIVVKPDSKFCTIIKINVGFHCCDYVAYQQEFNCFVSFT